MIPFFGKAKCVKTFVLLHSFHGQGHIMPILPSAPYPSTQGTNLFVQGKHLTAHVVVCLPIIAQAAHGLPMSPLILKPWADTEISAVCLYQATQGTQGAGQGA